MKPSRVEISDDLFTGLARVCGRRHAVLQPEQDTLGLCGVPLWYVVGPRQRRLPRCRACERILAIRERQSARKTGEKPDKEERDAEESG